MMVEKRRVTQFAPVTPDNPFDISMASESISMGAADAVRGYGRTQEVEREVTLAWSDPEHGIWLYQANCLTWMDRVAERWPDGVFDMIFADPPYFLSNGGITCHAGKMVSVNKGDWDKSRGIEENHEFNRAWLDRCQRVLKPNGTIWVSGTAHVVHSVGYAMQQLGFKLLNDITWVKPNPPPNLSCRYFTHATETIIWAAKHAKSKHYFDYQRMKKTAGGKQMKSVWEFRPPGREEKVHGKHPTQKPEALIARIVEASTNRGDLVLDPFAGSGTTAVAAARQDRMVVGLELEPHYVARTVARVQDMLLARSQTDAGRSVRQGRGD
jgi:site-specific DNA-methyltransferase (adenine-specific)